MIVTILDVIVQPLTTNSITAEFPIETRIVNITNGKCPLLFVNNRSNSIKLGPNQLIAVVKHLLEYAENFANCQVATTATDCDLTNHQPAALDKSLSCHTHLQKLDFALIQMTAKTYVVITAQKTKALRMLQQKREVFSLPGDKPTFTKELIISINSGTAKQVSRHYNHATLEQRPIICRHI
uniref:Uncharacterized protein n=1 Tax=Romanomermis culicivorax TaxID=13658 RepID=A0A915KUH0_ROMCU